MLANESRHEGNNPSQHFMLRVASRRTVGAFASLEVRLVSITFELGYRTSTSIPPGGGSGATRLALPAHRIVFHASKLNEPTRHAFLLFYVWVNSE